MSAPILLLIILGGLGLGAFAGIILHMVYHAAQVIEECPMCGRVMKLGTIDDLRDQGMQVDRTRVCLYCKEKMRQEEE